MNELGNTVREQRRSRGMTQTDLAALAEVGRRFVSELENGKANLRLGEALKVLRVFGLTLTTRPIGPEERD